MITREQLAVLEDCPAPEATLRQRWTKQRMTYMLREQLVRRGAGDIITLTELGKRELQSWRDSCKVWGPHSKL